MAHSSTVLIVDDSPLSLETLEGLLRNEGYQLALATNGREALEKAQTLGPDLILLDVMMPDMDGFEVCRRLRADPLLNEVPIIMVTALDDRQSRLLGLEIGADDFVSKPFDRAELRARVRTVVRLNRYRRMLAERARFEWAVEQADDGYLIVTDTGHLLYANTNARFYLGLPPESVALPEEDFFALTQRQYNLEPQGAADSDYAVLLNHADTAYYLVRPATAQESEFWLRVSATEIAGNAQSEYLVHLRDITANVLQQKEIWQFNSMVRHKLGTPLGVLLGAVEIFSKEHKDLPPQELDSLLYMARSGAKRLRSAIEDIFNFIEAPNLTRSSNEGCPVSDIPALIEIIQKEFKLNPVVVTYSGARSPETATVALHGKAFELILWEVLENAQKFHPQKNPYIEIDIACHPQGIRLRITDDGRTLPPDALRKIWLPYYQVERHFTGQVPGMGLGLPAVASVVWGVGGTCRAYNRADRPGLVIELILPMQSKSP